MKETLNISSTVKKLSDEICIKSQSEANYFPVDRNFLNRYLDRIFKVDNVDFIYCNLENLNNTYTVQLLCCLPELWKDIEYEELLLLVNSFSNIHSFYAFIEFTYKYLEINTIDIVMQNKDVSIEYKQKLLGFLINQYPNLIKEKDALNEFTKELLGVDYSQFEYLKQKLLLDDRIQPAVQTMNELKNQIERYNLSQLSD